MARKSQPSLFDAPKSALPPLPARSPIEAAVVLFAQRHQGRQFTLTDLEVAVRREVAGALFGAGRKALAALAGAGVVEYEQITAGIFRIIGVKP